MWVLGSLQGRVAAVLDLFLGGLISNHIRGGRVVAFHVPVELAPLKVQTAAEVALELGWMVVDKVAVGERVVADGAERVLRGRIERQQGAPAE